MSDNYLYLFGLVLTFFLGAISMPVSQQLVDEIKGIFAGRKQSIAQLTADKAALAEQVDTLTLQVQTLTQKLTDATADEPLIVDLKAAADAEVAG